MKRRGIDIMVIVGILKAAEMEVNKASIVYRANLNFKQADRYLRILQKQGLVENRQDKYATSEKGKSFLEKAKEIAQQLERKTR